MRWGLKIIKQAIIKLIRRNILLDFAVFWLFLAMPSCDNYIYFHKITKTGFHTCKFQSKSLVNYTSNIFILSKYFSNDISLFGTCPYYKIHTYYIYGIVFLM